MNSHYGELGDVWKHLLLAEVLRLNPPLHYWETHAGSASYPLLADATRLHGVLHFISRAPRDPELRTCAYLGALRDNPGIYPGSPSIAKRALGNDATYVLCDIDPESIATLKAAAGNVDARVIEGDGVSSIEAEADRGQFDPTHVLVHIDPFAPDERLKRDARTPVELAAHLANLGYRVFYWYGYDARSECGWARHALARLAPRVGLWCGDVLMPASHVYPDRSDTWGCGVVLAGATQAEICACERLGYALERISRDDAVDGTDPPHLTFQTVE